MLEVQAQYQEYKNLIYIPLTKGGSPVENKVEESSKLLVGSNNAICLARLHMLKSSRFSPSLQTNDQIVELRYAVACRL